MQPSDCLKAYSKQSETSIERNCPKSDTNHTSADVIKMPIMNKLTEVESSEK